MALLTGEWEWDDVKELIENLRLDYRRLKLNHEEAEERAAKGLVKEALKERLEEQNLKLKK